MAGIKFSRKEFEKHIKLTKEIEEKISSFGTHLESVTQDEVEVEITPNRPDLFSLQTFLKSFSAFLGKKGETGLRQYKLNKPEKDFQVTIKKSAENIRPFTACAIIKNLKFDDEKIKEIINIQEKIHSTLGRNRKKIAIGIYPLEKITLPITLEAKKPQDIKFQPLEMDKQINALQILQQHPTGREYAHLLEGKELFPIFIDAKNEVLSMPPIINSHKTGKITTQTKDIFIECSGFDLNSLKKTLNILTVMFAEMQGEVYQMNLIYEHNKIKDYSKTNKIQTPDLTPEKIKLSKENVNKLLGLELKETEIKSFLERMGHDYNTKTQIAEIPGWRADIMHEVDLIEDIAIAYGYDNFIPEIPSIATTGEISRIELMKKKISEIICGVNISEISSYHLMTQEDIERLNLNKEELVEVEKSKSEYKFLRPSLLSSALKILSQNTDKEYPQRIFEMGTTFEIDKENKMETGIKEPKKLCICLASNNSNFTEIKQILDYLMRVLNKDYTIEQANQDKLKDSFFIDARTGEIKVNNQPIGLLGEIHPQTLINLGIKMPVAALEIDIEQLCEGNL